MYGLKQRRLSVLDRNNQSLSVFSPPSSSYDNEVCPFMTTAHPQLSALVWHVPYDISGQSEGLFYEVT